MKKTLIILIISFFISSFTKSAELFAHIDKIIFLQGKVGERTLVVKVKCFDENPKRYLNYFFDDDKKDRALEGDLVGNVWQFVANNNSQAEIELYIQEEKDGNWKGFLSQGSKQKINVILTPIVINSDSNFYSFIKNKELDLYDAAKISFIKLKKTKTEKFNKKFFLDWLCEKESDISFFRLHSSDSTINLDSINNSFEYLQLSLIQNFFRFSPIGKNPKFKIEITILNETLISFKITSNTLQKNSNAIQRQHFFNYDIKSGASIVLENIIWFDPNSKPETDSMAIYDYRKNVFASTVFSILNELYPEQMKNSECNLNKVSKWAIPNFLLTKKGIQLSISNATNCSLMDWAIIPYKKLEPYLLMNYKFNQILK